MNLGNDDNLTSLLSHNQLLFAALGDESRQDIIMLLAEHEQLSVGELARRTQLSRPAVSHHIRILKEAGLLRDTRQGTRRYYRPSFSGAVQSMRRLVAQLDRNTELL